MRLIDADKLERKEFYGNEYCFDYVDAEGIDNAPTVDAVEVMHGRWVPTTVPFMNECEDCSVCGYRTVWGHRYNYCPRCGAKMDGGDNAEG